MKRGPRDILDAHAPVLVGSERHEALIDAEERIGGRGTDRAVLKHDDILSGVMNEIVARVAAVGILQLRHFEELQFGIFIGAAKIENVEIGVTPILHAEDELGSFIAGDVTEKKILFAMNDTLGG